MGNKILKQNAIMILYITNCIEQLKKDVDYLKKECTYRDKYIDIKVYNRIIEYFEACLKDVLDD